MKNALKVIIFSGCIFHILLVSPSAYAGESSKPVAVDDKVTMNADQLKNRIPVLANDRGLNDTPISVKLTGKAKNGRAWVDTKKQVVFRPNKGFVGTEALVYRVKDQDGDVATAKLSIRVVCSKCTATSNITLSWKPVAGKVNGYRVYYGRTGSTANSLATDTSANFAAFNTGKDLELSAGDPVCFRVQAYNAEGKSPLSEAICGTV